MFRRLLRSIVVRGAEAALTVALVLLFFFASLAMLGRAFPQGTNLHDLMTGTGWSAAPQQPLTLDPGLPASGGDGGPRYAARLTDVYRKVKDKPPTGIAWSDARLGSLLQERHAVQTFERSGATIALEAHGQVTLGENSLIVIRSLAARDPLQEKGGVSLLMTRGTLEGEFSFTGPGETPLELATADGTSKLGGAAGASNFRVSVNPDSSSTFTVYSGSAEISAAGKTVELRANQAVTVSRPNPPGPVIDLPDPPTPVAPEAESSFPYRNVPPRVTWEWQDPDTKEGYRLQIARDRDFRDLVHEERTDGTEFVHGNLPAGSYYWRINGVAGWAVGPPSEVRRVEMVEDREPPALQVDFPDAALESDSVLLRGVAERGADVYVANRKVDTDASGRFETVVPLRRGLNVVVAEALDRAGNSAYRSQVLDARY